jgi:hypothetical protein
VTPFKGKRTRSYCTANHGRYALAIRFPDDHWRKLQARAVQSRSARRWVRVAEEIQRCGWDALRAYQVATERANASRRMAVLRAKRERAA